MARLVPAGIPRSGDEDDARLAALERAGVLHAGAGRLPEGFWKLPRPRDRAGAVRSALDEDRAEGR